MGRPPGRGDPGRGPPCDGGPPGPPGGQGPARPKIVQTAGDARYIGFREYL